LKCNADIQKEKRYSPTYQISETTRKSPVNIYKTPNGQVFLRNCCAPTFVEAFEADEGLRVFTPLPERELQLTPCRFERRRKE
jgi:hypothetical protein